MQNNYKKRTFIPKEHLPTLKGEKLLPYMKNNKAGIVDSFSTYSNLFISITEHDFSKVEKKFICISVADDCSQTIAIQKHIKDLDIVFLDYDHIGVKWDFCYYKQRLVFIVNNKYILPLGIYNRSFIPPTDDPRHEHCLNLNFAVQVWQGYKINCGMENYYNSSKPLQVSLINKIINCVFEEFIKIPDSFIIKNRKAKAKKYLKNKKLIVKSCSGIRSKVEDESNFINWDFNHINNLPTLFQERITGRDIRVHVVKSKIYSIQIKEKQGIDYRYNKNSGFELIQLPKNIKKFCFLLKKFEKLNLVGIDLIFNQELGKYYIIENNPNPGWAGFHRNTNEEASLARDIIDV